MTEWVWLKKVSVKEGRDGIKQENVVNPNHYAGNNGLMASEQLYGYYLGNVMKYILRHQKKNKLEDLYKAREHLNWLIGILE